MPKNENSISPEEKEYLKTFKMIFSSLSRRLANVAIFTSSEDSVMLMNPTTAKDTPFADRITEFGNTDLTAHLVTFKNKDFLRETKEWIFGTTKFKIGCANTSLLNSLLVKSKFRAGLQIVTDDSCTRVIKSSDPETDDIEIARYLSDYVLVAKILDTWKKCTIIGTPEHQNTHRHISITLDPKTRMDGKIYFLPINLNALDSNLKGHLDLLCNDGMSSPAIKEFISKRKFLKWEGYAWLEDNLKLRYCTLYEDDDISVCTYQPNYNICIFNNSQIEWEKICH